MTENIAKTIMNNLNEGDYSDKLGGNASDFETEMNKVRTTLKELRDNCGAHLSEDIIDQTLDAFEEILNREKSNRKI